MCNTFLGVDNLANIELDISEKLYNIRKSASFVVFEPQDVKLRINFWKVTFVEI